MSKTEQVHYSESRLKIAQIIDEVFVKAIKLFDLSSIKKLDQWLIGYARRKLFEKMQTLWIMGKKKDFIELLDCLEEQIPKLRELAESPDLWTSADGKALNPADFDRWRHVKVPKKVMDLISEDRFWSKDGDAEGS